MENCTDNPQVMRKLKEFAKKLALRTSVTVVVNPVVVVTKQYNLVPAKG